MLFSISLFTIGFAGFIINRSNMILMLVSLEVIILAASVIILQQSVLFNDNEGQLFAVFIIAVAGAESVLALTFLTNYYKLRNNISIL